MPKLTLASLLDPLPNLADGSPGRICLMRHAFRGHKDQLAKLEKWTKAKLTVDQAYPPESSDTIGTPSAAQVLNAVRLDRRLARLASGDQTEDRLNKGDIILAFAATGGRSAEFLAAFEVKGTMGWDAFQREYEDLLIKVPESARKAGLHGVWLARGMGYNALPRDGDNFALVDRTDILEGLERRLVVEWLSGVSWFQRDLNKEVLEIRPKGFVREFTGLLDFTLSFDELRAIVGLETDPEEGPTRPSIEGDPVWRAQLAEVGGVYIIQSDEGPLYVGAAYGAEGFLGRWSVYTRTNETSGGPEDKAGLRSNTGVKRFLDEGNPDQQRKRAKGLKFSIAHVMDRSARRQDVLDMERWFKEKLGTRASALDLNEN